MKISAKIWHLLMENWWFRHICFLGSLVLFFAWGSGFINNSFGSAVINGLGYIPGTIVVVYPFLYILIPKLLYNKNFVLLALSFLALILIAKGVTEMMLYLIPNKSLFRPQRFGVGRNMTPFVMVAAIAATAKLVKYYYFRQQKADKEQEQRIQTELELLKSQIHPNFLFNTLNNLFAHTIKNSNESPNIVLKLSDLLRFMIYESRCEFIPLDHEIQLLKNYIELEKLRHENDLDVSFITSGNMENKMIRPLLLLPLVEFAFKQATSESANQKWISLNIHAEENKLMFNLTNSRTAPAEEMDVAMNGINNVRKRLEMLYPSEYSMTISEEDDLNMISLDLTLNDAITLPQNISLIRNRAYEMEMPVGG
jgi:sensor histidine kinase YesM